MRQREGADQELATVEIEREGRSTFLLLTSIYNSLSETASLSTMSLARIDHPNRRLRSQLTFDLLLPAERSSTALGCDPSPRRRLGSSSSRSSLQSLVRLPHSSRTFPLPIHPRRFTESTRSSAESDIRSGDGELDFLSPPSLSLCARFPLVRFSISDGLSFAHL